MPNYSVKWTAAITCAFLSGCTLALVNEAPRNGFAQVTLPRLDDGTEAIKVYSVDSKHHFFTQPTFDARTLTLKPGTYNVEVDCFRPGAFALVDISFNFEFSVEADHAYTLDCSPTSENNGFVLLDAPADLKRSRRNYDSFNPAFVPSTCTPSAISRSIAFASSFGALPLANI